MSEKQRILELIDSDMSTDEQAIRKAACGARVPLSTPYWPERL